MANANFNIATFARVINLTNEEFTEQCRSGEINVEIFCNQILSNIQSSVIEFNTNNLKLQDKFISFVKDAIPIDTLQHYFKYQKNPMSGTNVIILACKYNNTDSLKYILSDNNSLLSFFNEVGVNLQPDAIDNECHNAFYYALRSNNVKNLKLLVERWPDNYFDQNPDKLDDCLSKAYNEMKLKNIGLCDNIKLSVEEILFNQRFFHNELKGLETGTTTLKIKERVMLVLDVFSMLSNSMSSNIFMFKIMFIAKNIFVLKQQLKVLYNALPWEEMEFCLMSFINTSRKQNANLYNTTLAHHKILIHLKNFCSSLKIEICKIEDNASVLELACKPRINRSSVVAKVLVKYPYFKELYDDYEQIRDLYSLEKIKSFNRLVLSVDPNKDEERYTLIKVLYIMGENLKNTLMSPNLSETTFELFELSLPKNCKNLLPNLRDLWFHSNELRPWNESKENWTAEYFARIQKSILNINEIITDICQEKKYQITRILLEKISNSINLDETKEFLKLLNNLNWCDTIDDYPKVNRLKSLEAIMEELKNEIRSRTSYEEELFKQIKEILYLVNDKFKLMKFDYALWAAFKELSFSFFTMNLSQSYLLELKHKSRELLDYFRKWEFENLKTVLENTRKIYENAFRRLPKSQVKVIKYLVVEINKIGYLEIDELECLSELKNLLCKSKTHSKKISRSRMYNDDQINESLKRAQKSLYNTLNKSKSYKTMKDNKWHDAIEVFLLDILTILDDVKHSFTNNNNFIDSPAPILMGKNLRNHLAHENVLFDLSFETSRLSFLNANKFVSCDILQIKNPIDKIIKNNPNKLKINFNHDLKILSIQNKFFTALTLGDIDLAKKQVEAGADLNARDDNLWTSLHFAAKVPNVDVLLFVLQHVHNINPKDRDGLTPLHISAYYNNNSVLKHLLNQSASPNDVDNFGRTPLHIAAQLGHINVVQILLNCNKKIEIIDQKFKCPLQYAVENGHLDVVQMLLMKENNLHKISFTTGCTPLHIAAKRGHISLINFFIKSNLNVNVLNNEYDTPLHNAVEFGQKEVALQLLSNGANVNARNIYGKTPIYVAIQNGYNNIVAILLDLGAKVNCRDILDVTPLHIAARFGHLNIAQKLIINYNSQIDAIDDEGMSPLHIAAANGHTDVVKFLFEKKAIIDTEDLSGRTALHFIIKNCDKDLTKFVIQSGINPNNKFRYGITLLHLAAEVSSEETVEALISHGAVDSPDDNGWLALHYCCLNSKQGIADLLIKNGSDINCMDLYQITPFHLACERGSYIFIKSIINICCSLNKDIEMNIKSRNGFTALHFCVEANHCRVADMLIDNGADIDVEDYCGDTPLCVAIRNNSFDMVELLVSKGADINASNGKPLRLSLINNYEDIVDFLLESDGINVNLMNNSLTVIEISSVVGSDIIDYLLHKKSVNSILQENDMTFLQLAAMNGSANILKAILDKDVKMWESTFNCDLAPLHIASLLGNDDVVSILLDRNAYVDIQIEGNFTPLHLASLGGHIQIIKNLLSHNANPHIKNQENMTAIEIAVLNGNQDAVEALSQHVNILDIFDQNSTLLHIAAKTGNLNMIQYLISKRVDNNIKDTTGAKPFHIAARFNHIDLLDYFLNTGELNEMDYEDFNLLMQIVLSHESTKLLQYLIEHEIDVNRRNLNGDSPLHIAAENDNENAVRLLLINGAFYNSLNEFDEKPYEITNNMNIFSLLETLHNIFKAVKEENIFMLKECLNVNTVVFVNTKDAYNFALLHYAALSGFQAGALYLLDNGANPNIVRDYNNTPLHDAAQYAHRLIIIYLLSYGAIYNYPLTTGDTPLDIAQRMVNNSRFDDITFIVYSLIVVLFKQVRKNFAMLENGNTEIINFLQRVRNTKLLKAFMCVQNIQKQTLIHVAVLNNFCDVEALKQIGQNEFSDQMREFELFQRLGNYDSALILLEDVLSKRIDILGEVNPGTLDIKHKKADLFCKQLKYHEAFNLYQEVYECRKLLFGGNGKDTLKTKIELASTLHFMGYHNEALHICDEIYESQIVNYIGNQSDIWYTYYRRGTILESLEKSENALDIYLKIVQNKQIDPNKSPEDVIITLKAKNGIARIFGKHCRYNEAKKLYQDNIKNSTIIFGPYYSLTLRTNYEFSVILIKQKKFQSALQLLHNILSINLCISGAKHPNTLIVHQQIAKLYFTQGQTIKSFKLYKQTFRELESVLGPSDPVVLNSSQNIEKITLILKFNISYGIELLKQIEMEVKEIGEYGCEILWNYLIKNGLDVNVKNFDGWRLLHYAAMSGQDDVIEILLKNGADIMSVNDLGETSLHISASRHQTHMIKILLKHVENNCTEFNQFINAKSVKGDTALHMACSRTSDSLVIVIYLLQCGAMFDVQNNDMKMPINVTENQGIKSILEKIARFFKSCRNCTDNYIDELHNLPIHDFLAVTNARNSQGNTLLQETLLHGSLNVAKSLEYLLENKHY